MSKLIELEQVGQLEGTFESTGRIYLTDGLCPTINTMGGGDREPKVLIPQATKQGCITAESNGLCKIEPIIAVMRGREVEPSVLTPKRTEHGKAMRKAYESGEHKESRHTMQQLEPRSDDITNTITTVQKDNLVVEPHFRIRKLTPKECFRLMGFTDEDFHKAKNALNKTFYKGADRSNSQLYKQAGNSIVVQVLESIFRQMKGEE